MWSSPAPERGKTSGQYRVLNILQKSTFHQARRIAAGDDDVIKDSDVDEAAGVLQALGDELVRLRRLCDSARMRVGEDHGRGVLL
jgi:hypothetical protein